MRTPTLREFTLQLSALLYEIHPEIEGIGMVYPAGHPELMTRDAAQINAWLDADERLAHRRSRWWPAGLRRAGLAPAATARDAASARLGWPAAR